MEGELTQEQRDWRERFQAVAQAQGRYLYLLLLTGLFFLALADQLRWLPVNRPASESPSFLGLKLSIQTLFAAGPAVISVIVHAALGTFPALRYAHRRAAAGLVDERLFERMDSVPTAIDFVVYADAPKGGWRRLFLLGYPICLWLAITEAIALELSLLEYWSLLHTSLRVLGVLGGLSILLSLPRLVTLTVGKVGDAVGRPRNARRPA